MTEPRYTLAEHHKMHGKHAHDRYNCDGCDAVAKWAIENFIRDELPGLLAVAAWGMDFGDPEVREMGVTLAAKIAELRSKA